MNALSRWAVLFAAVNGRGAIGMREVRDPDSPCDAFLTKEQLHEELDCAAVSSFPPPTDCESDGHYLCEDCVRLSPRERARREGRCTECGRPLPKPRAFQVAHEVPCPVCTEQTTLDIALWR